MNVVERALYIIEINDNGTTVGILLDDLIKSCTFLDKLCKINNAIFNRIRIYRGSYGFISTIRIYYSSYKFINNLVLCTML